MRIFIWLVRALAFFTLFAFALNNQQESAVCWFFGYAWHAPMVIIVLAAFTMGCAVGVLAMLPSWWKHRRVARRHTSLDTPNKPEIMPAAAAPSADFATDYPSRDGL